MLTRCHSLIPWRFDDACDFTVWALILLFSFSSSLPVMVGTQAPPSELRLIVTVASPHRALTYSTTPALLLSAAACQEMWSHAGHVAMIWRQRQLQRNNFLDLQRASRCKWVINV